jgi:hypothetical protein
MPRRAPCLLGPGRSEAEQPVRADARALLAALVTAPHRASSRAVERLAATHGLTATLTPLTGPGGASELVLLVPSDGAAAADEHWLLALWRDGPERLRRVALFACVECWHAPPTES